MSGPGQDPFATSRAQFDAITRFLDSPEAANLNHYELEVQVRDRGRDLLRSLVQNYFDHRADHEPRLEGVTDAQGVQRTRVERGHHRLLTTIFGDVRIDRAAYRSPGHPNLHPTDAVLNLPPEQHSHLLRRMAATEAARGSFEEAASALERDTGQPIGKRQVEELTRHAAKDVDAFYESAPRKPVAPADILVLSADGKGVVMRHDALRSATKAAAEKSSPKIATRLSKGEKRNRKRMAEVAAVYDAAPVPRVPEDILAPADRAATDGGPEQEAPAPKAQNKWLMAGVVDDAATVIHQMFAEADRRDPNHARPWVALVDGNQHQIDRINAEAQSRALSVTIVIDIIHVLEYLWKAAWSFYPEGDPRAEAWVREKALAILRGKAGVVAAAVRRKATCLALAKERRKGAAVCADYLLSKKRYLDYPTALQRGWPIATGVIEGACRHLIKDRMDITGARWGLDGAEAVLKLRALRTNGDFDAYWTFHLEQEHRRVHQARYANGRIPLAAA
jgi:hypothetical protein